MTAKRKKSSSPLSSRRIQLPRLCTANHHRSFTFLEELKGLEGKEGGGYKPRSNKRSSEKNSKKGKNASSTGKEEESRMIFCKGPLELLISRGLPRTLEKDRQQLSDKQECNGWHRGPSSLEASPKDNDLEASVDEKCEGAIIDLLAPTSLSSPPSSFEFFVEKDGGLEVYVDLSEETPLDWLIAFSARRWTASTKTSDTTSSSHPCRTTMKDTTHHQSLDGSITTNGL